MPTVMFDVRSNHDTGVSRYGLSLLAAAAPLAVDAGWRVHVIASPWQYQRAAAAAAHSRAIRIHCCPDAETFVRRSAWLRALLLRERADLYYTSHYTVDRRCPVPFVFTIHDLTRLRFPALSYTERSFAEKHSPAELEFLRHELSALASWDRSVRPVNVFHRYFWSLNSYLSTQARRIVTVSATSQHDIETMLGIPRSKIALVRAGVNHLVFRHRQPHESSAVRRQLRIPGRYLLFVGLAHPNKRFHWLVEQLLAARQRLPPDLRLVAVGGHAERQAETLRRPDPGFVIYTGRVSDSDLAALYSGAVAYVTASVSEGSNLPAQEALACGCPVIATDIPAHRETLGNAAYYYRGDRGRELADLAVAAAAGLPSPTWGGPDWSTSGQALMRSLIAALNLDQAPAS